MNRIIWGLLLLAVGAGALAGCDTQDQQEEFEQMANRPPAGYTATTESGEVQSRDEDDWRTAPLYRGRVRIEPAFPNPAQGEVINIPVTVLFEGIRGGLDLRAYDYSFSPPRLVRIATIPEAQEPGFYSFTFPSGIAPFAERGLHRVFLFDGPGNIVSYGDILIE